MEMSYTRQEIIGLLGDECAKAFLRLHEYMIHRYQVQQNWSAGGKYGDRCLCYRCAGRSLCTVYFRDKQFALWIVLGQADRQRVEEAFDQFSPALRALYQQTPVLHDGKWLMLDITDDALLPDIFALLTLKKKPNKKLSMCGYCCASCQANQANILKQDDRAGLASVWKEFYGLDFTPEAMVCDGCRCTKPNARRIDSGCPVRACVKAKGLTDCSQCPDYPCETFLSREGLSHSAADCIRPTTLSFFATYLDAFDNKTRLDENHTP